jgi:hypothetical protein
MFCFEVKVMNALSSQSRSVEQFIKKVEGVYEVEYGDFRRKVGQYLLKMESELGSAVRLNPKAAKIVSEIRRRIIYQPEMSVRLKEPSIDQARAVAVSLARELATLV